MKQRKKRLRERIPGGERTEARSESAGTGLGLEFHTSFEKQTFIVNAGDGTPLAGVLDA